MGIGGGEAEEAVIGGSGGEEDVGGLARGVGGVGKGADEPGVAAPGVVGETDIFEGEEGDGVAEHGEEESLVGEVGKGLGGGGGDGKGVVEVLEVEED